jgi:hypothetical protein
MRWARYAAAGIVRMRNSYLILVGKAEDRSLGRLNST